VTTRIASILPLALLSAHFFAAKAGAFKDAGNRPYVQSGADGVFYARCIPQDATGSAGSTDIFKVQKERDELVDHYDWFTRHGVVLGWSPIAGKVAVMAIHRDAPASPDKQVEFGFYLGGTLLKSWTTAELNKLGAEVSPSHYGGERAVFQVLGCEQIPGTNEYVFTIQLGKDKKLSFDILTGGLLHK
jgi:hypothetical protein